MTAADLGDETSARQTGSSPLAQVSLAALRDNAALIDGSVDAFAELPADGWGHGEAEVAAAVSTIAPGASTGSTDEAEWAITTLLGLPGGDARSRPALRLVGTVLSTKDLRAGEGVSYGLTFRAPADTRVALVTGGYAQGVVRSLGNRVSVSIGGRHLPIVGRVAMDVCVVEVSDAAVARGDRAVFFGDPRRNEPDLGEWCAQTRLTALELVTAVGLHTRREHVA